MSSRKPESTLQLPKPDPVETLPKPSNAGLIDIEWVIEDLTKSEVQQSGWNEVFRIKKVPPACADASVGRLQAFLSVPAGSGLTVYCNVKVYFVREGEGVPISCKRRG